MNERIRAREVRVIDDEGKQIGILPPFEALKMARSKNLDLVEISPTAQPPVCRIMDYGKFLYQQEKKEREAKKHQKVITVKEVKFRINVDEHDYQTKKNLLNRLTAPEPSRYQFPYVRPFQGRALVHIFRGLRRSTGLPTAARF